MSGVVCTRFGAKPSNLHKSDAEIAAAIEEAVARHVHGETAAKLDPTVITVELRTAQPGSRSGYIYEVVVTLDYADYPFGPGSFNTPAAQQACLEKAQQIWLSLLDGARFSRAKPFLVWILAGHMTAYWDGFEPSE